MLRRPGVWLYAAGGWLVVGGVTHTAWHVWALGAGNGLIGQHELAMSAMRQAFYRDPLGPSMWSLYRSLSLSFGVLVTFAGVTNIALAWIDARPATLRVVALLGATLWTALFVPAALFDPTLQTLVIPGMAVPLHGIVYLTAAAAREPGSRATDTS